MAKNAPDDYQKFLSKICNLIFRKKYLQAEKVVLERLENILGHKYNQKDNKEKDIILLETLCMDFSDYYCKWLANKRKGTENYRNLVWKNQYHLFINHCTDPAMMYNLFWKLGGFLVSKENNINIQEIHFDLEEYKKLCQRHFISS